MTYVTSVAYLHAAFPDALSNVNIGIYTLEKSFA